MSSKCQRCQERAATVHLTEIDDDEKTELHLCEQCAQQQNGPLELMGMLSSAFTPESSSTAADPAGLRCPECSLGYVEFRSRGRLGCPDCYETFRGSLEPLLEKIHGGTQHVGKAPDASSAVDRSRERRLVELRRELQSTVRDERYEDAARLRDELTRFEAGLDDPVVAEPACDEAAPEPEPEPDAEPDAAADGDGDAGPEAKAEGGDDADR